MAKKKIRVAVIGIGGIGGGHARAVAKHPGMEMAAFLDTAPEIMKRAAEEFPHAVGCSTLEELLEVPDLHAAIVATPNNVHARYTIACANAGLHVLCEKPLGMNVKEAEAMLAAAKKNRVIGMTNFSYRWVPSFALLRETIREGHFGGIRRLHVKYLQSGLMDPTKPLVWRNRIEIAGYGALGDLGSHMSDAARFITGAEPKRVVGVANIHVASKPDPKTGRPGRVTTDTDAQFMVDFGQFVGIFETSQVEPAHGNHLVLSVGGERGSARVYSEDGEQLEIACGAPYATAQTWQTCLPKTAVPTSKRRQFVSGRPCIDDFFNAIRKRTRDYPSFEDGLAAQRVLDGVLKSARTNRWEKV